MKITLAAQLVSVQSRVDRTYKLTFNTQELGGDAAMLMGMLMDSGWLLFSPNDDIKEEDIPESQADPDLNQKSASQRLRNCLFVYWRQRKDKGETSQSWEQFYTSQLERLIEGIKGKLEDSPMK